LKSQDAVAVYLLLVFPPRVLVLLVLPRPVLVFAPVLVLAGRMPVPLRFSSAAPAAPPVFAFVFAPVLVAFVVFVVGVLVVVVLVVFAVVVLAVVFAFVFAFAFVLSAEEQAAPAMARASKATRAKVLRIEFPPVPLGSVLTVSRAGRAQSSP
jgi:uncharacterized membrane protein (UPF0182 family)